MDPLQASKWNITNKKTYIMWISASITEICKRRGGRVREGQQFFYIFFLFFSLPKEEEEEEMQKAEPEEGVWERDKEIKISPVSY